MRYELNFESLHIWKDEKINYDEIENIGLCIYVNVIVELKRNIIKTYWLDDTQNPVDVYEKKTT